MALWFMKVIYSWLVVTFQSMLSKDSVCSDDKLFKGQELVSISEIPDCSALPSLEMEKSRCLGLWPI